MTSKTSEKAIKKKSESTGKKKSKKSKKSDPEKENISVVSFFFVVWLFCFVLFLHKRACFFFLFVFLIIQCSEHEKLNGYPSVQSIVKNNPFFINSINEKNSMKIVPVNYGRVYSWKNKKMDEEEIDGGKLKVIIPSGKSLHEDDLSYIDVKSLVSFFFLFYF